jgi:Tfp pilus assembly PilM family ATPase
MERSIERFLKKVTGKQDVEDALKRLDRLTNDEARMTTAQALKATRHVDDIVRAVDDNVIEVIDRTLNRFNKQPTKSTK